MKKLLLSASVPNGTADSEAIRAAVSALADVVAQDAEWHLVWGGHPTITPMLAEGLARHGLRMSDRVTVYLSREFFDVMASESVDLGVRVMTERLGSREESLRRLRERMIGENVFEAAVFIGGMAGVEQEYALLREMQPQTKCLPVASTGGAAKKIFDAGAYDDRLSNSAYRALSEVLL
jgi:hypothetical protein